MKPRRGVLLDRDGVINFDSPDYIRSPQQWQPLPGSLEAIAQLKQAGYLVAVVSNQSGVERGLFDQKTLNAIHLRLQREVHKLGGHIDAFFFCTSVCDRHPDRKPQPGMLHQVQQRLGWTSLAGVPFVGDSWRDLQAARAAGAQPVLVLTGNGTQTRHRHATELDDTDIYPSLDAAVEQWLTQE